MAVASKMRLSRSVVLGVFMLAATAGCGPADSERLSADEILALMGDAYASAGTYRDSGTSVLRLEGPAEGLEGTKTLRFSTAFRSPEDFRFAYKSDTREWGHVLLTTDAGVESWVEGAEIPLPHESVQTALRGATAPSSAVSMIIAPLLFPEASPVESLLTLTAATRLADQEVDGFTRIVVQGAWYDRAITVWMDPETYLVMRVDIVAENVGPESSGRAVQTIQFDPEVAVEITPADLLLGRGTVEG